MSAQQSQSSAVQFARILAGIEPSPATQALLRALSRPPAWAADLRRIAENEATIHAALFREAGRLKATFDQIAKTPGPLARLLKDAFENSFAGRLHPLLRPEGSTDEERAGAIRWLVRRIWPRLSVRKPRAKAALRQIIREHGKEHVRGILQPKALLLALQDVHTEQPLRIGRQWYTDERGRKDKAQPMKWDAALFDRWIVQRARRHFEALLLDATDEAGDGESLESLPEPSSPPAVDHLESSSELARIMTSAKLTAQERRFLLATHQTMQETGLEPDEAFRAAAAMLKLSPEAKRQIRTRIRRKVNPR